MGDPTRPTTRRHTRLWRAAIAFVAALAALAVPSVARAVPLGSLSITPLEWNVVGLDSNRVEDGPHLFHLGAKVCNTGATTLTGATATWTWDSVQSSVSLAGPATRNLPDLAPADCVSTWFGVDVTVAKASWNTKRTFHVTASASGAASVSTPANRGGVRREAGQPEPEQCHGVDGRHGCHGRVDVHLHRRTTTTRTTRARSTRST